MKKCTSYEWINKQFSILGYTEDSKRKLYTMYEQFQKEADSSISLATYKRTIRKIYNRYIGKVDSDGNLSDYVSEEFNGNNRILSYKGPRILTTDQIIDVCDIDLDEWNIDKTIINKWEQGRRNKKTSLSWNNGVMDGSVEDKGNIFIEPMFQVKVWLSRKVLQKCSLPEFKPLVVSNSHSVNKKNTSTKNNSCTNALVLGDAQMGFVRDFKSGKLFPLHDRRVLSLAGLIIRKLQPDYLLLNGDFFDFTELTDKFLNTPEYYYSLQPAFLEFAWWMNSYKQDCPSMKMIYIAGNHENRLYKHILKYTSFAYGLKSIDKMEGYDILSIPNLAGFDSLGIEWINEYKTGSSYWIGDVEITHGIKASGKSGSTVTNIINSATHSQIVGHTHKFEHAEKTINDCGKRKEISIWSFGTMGRVDGMIPSTYGFMNWQQGFGVLSYNPMYSLHSIVPIRVNNGLCVYDNEVYVGGNPCGDIARDLDWNSLDTENVEEDFPQVNF